MIKITAVAFAAGFLGLAVGMMLQGAPARAVDTVDGQNKNTEQFFEARIYTAAPGKMEALHKRFREHTLELFAKHGMSNIGYWTPAEGDTKDNTLIYILAYPSREARDASWKAFMEDPEWQKVYQESQPDGVKLAEKVESIFLKPTDYSPLK